jgi:hypothetical protein
MLPTIILNIQATYSPFLQSYTISSGHTAQLQQRKEKYPLIFRKGNPLSLKPIHTVSLMFAYKSAVI